MNQNKFINTLIAYDQQLVADGLKEILFKQKEINLLESVNNDQDIFDVVNRLNPDLIVFEFLFWKTKYNETMSKLHQMFPDVKILIISELVSQEILKSIMPFINGYLLKTCSSEKLILAIHEVIVSGKYLCPKAIDEYFKCTRTVNNDSELTSREKEILCSWMESKGNHEIADNLNISESTVRTHLNNIRQKLGNLNHLEMMIYACKQNIMNRNFRPICPNCRSFCG
jgi:DNA-binding NarL/FixJ family response regulator